MQEALIQVGLPVHCVWADCTTKGFVKPWTNYGGWMKRAHRKWYCPEHAKKAKSFYDSIAARYATPDPQPTEQDVTTELYNLID